MTVTDSGMKELLLSSELLSAKRVFRGSFYIREAYGSRGEARDASAIQ